MHWFRFHTDFRSDLKVVGMSFQRQIQLVRLLCLRASEGPLDQFSDEMIARGIGVRHKTLVKVRLDFESRGFIGPDSWEPLNWHKRQFQSDSCRGPASRARGRAQARDQARPRQNRTETETEHTPPTPSNEGACVCVSTSTPEERPYPPRPVIPDTNKDPEVLQVAAKAEALFPMLHFGGKVHGAAIDYPAKWIERALEVTHAQDGVNPRWSYVIGILRRWQAEGGPPVLPRGRPPKPLNDGHTAATRGIEPQRGMTAEEFADLLKRQAAKSQPSESAKKWLATTSGEVAS